jgi:hypothetical protein
MDMALAAGLLGLQDRNSIAAGFALALVTHTLRPWAPPTGADLTRARRTAARFKLSDDLAVFLPQEPGRFAARARKATYRGLVISLKQLDALAGEERVAAIAELRGLLGQR